MNHTSKPLLPHVILNASDRCNARKFSTLIADLSDRRSAFTPPIAKKAKKENKALFFPRRLAQREDDTTVSVSISPPI